MAVTPTPRLALNKQDAGDLGWSGPLNSGFDNADARFMTTSAGTPVGVQQGFFVGQLHFQTGTAPPTVWICTVVGSPGTWVLLGQVALGYNGIIAALILNNTIALQGKEAGGTARNLAHMSAADKVLLGALTNLLTLQTNAASALKVDYGSGEQTIWHAGNDGSGSGLDADLLDGLNKTDLLTFETSTPLYFESSPQTVTFSAATSVAHGLSTRPRLWSVALRNVTAEGGFSTNDEIHLGDWDDGATLGCVTFVDATNIGISTFSVFRFPTKGGGSNFNVTAANWRYIFRAWK